MGLTLVFLFVAGVIAFGLSAICGGGASFILLPLLGLMLPGAQVPAALSVGTAASSLSRIAIFWKNIQWRIVIWFVPPALPFVWLGAYLLTFINPVYLELFLGLFLVSNIPFLLKKSSPVSNKGKLPVFFLSIIGGLAGFVSGLTGAVGLLFNRFYLRYQLTKEQIVATRAANELLLHLTKIALYASFGLLTQKGLIFGGFIALSAFSSAWMMKKVLPRISENIFRKIGYAAMVVSGFVMMVNSSENIIMANNIGLDIKPVSEGAESKLNWRKSTFALEFEYDEGFEFERSVAMTDLPEDKKRFVKEHGLHADTVMLEEVYGFQKHYYEVYVYRHRKVEKFEL